VRIKRSDRVRRNLLRGTGASRRSDERARRCRRRGERSFWVNVRSRGCALKGRCPRRKFPACLLTNDRFDYNPTMKLANWLAMAALALAVLGILLFVEVIRPFHDLSIDGPLALLSWGSGAGLALVTLWLRGRSVILSAV